MTTHEILARHLDEWAAALRRDPGAVTQREVAIMSELMANAAKHLRGVASAIEVLTAEEDYQR